MSMERLWNDTVDTRSAERNTCPGIALSIVNSTWTGLGSNSRFFGERLA
jgi:hypothetical protein